MPFSGLAAGLAAQVGSPDDALSELAVAGPAITSPADLEPVVDLVTRGDFTPVA